MCWLTKFKVFAHYKHCANNVAYNFEPIFFSCLVHDILYVYHIIICKLANFHETSYEYHAIKF
jgi:hypothetical protein